MQFYTSTGICFQDYVNCIVKILTDLLLSSSVCCEVYEGSSDMYDETGR